MKFQFLDFKMFIEFYFKLKLRTCEAIYNRKPLNYFRNTNRVKQKQLLCHEEKIQIAGILGIIRK